MRKGLDRATIVDAGCQLARQNGVESIGVRSVAGVAGVTPMALYRYVSNAGDLRDAVLARLCESLPARPAFITDVSDWAHAFRAWLIDVPRVIALGVAPLV